MDDNAVSSSGRSIQSMLAFTSLSATLEVSVAGLGPGSVLKTQHPEDTTQQDSTEKPLPAPTETISRNAAFHKFCTTNCIQALPCSCD